MGFENWAIDRYISNKLGGSMMARLVALAAMFAGGASILTGLSCAAMHLSAGDFMENYKQCMALVTAGTAVFTPGLQSLKVGIFTRASSAPTGPSIK
jgi:hypothetical protein